MTGWALASATTALIGAAAMGPAAYGQGAIRWVAQPAPPALEVLQDLEFPVSVSGDWEQAVRVFAGSGGRIGVTIRDLSDEELKAGKGAAGVKIDDVEADSPAAKAGFKVGDIVVEFDGERVRSSRQFTRLVTETPPGRTVQAGVQREGQRVTLTVTPRDSGSYSFNSFKMPAPAARLDLVPRMKMFAAAGQLGVSVDEVSGQLAEYFGTKDGVLVTSVTANSAAGKAGLRAGDVITSIDGGQVTTAADLRRRAQRLEEGDEFTLNIVRDKKPMTLKGKIEVPAAKRPGRTIL